MCQPHLSSQIVSAQQWVDLIKLCEFSPTDKWTRLYRASEDGFAGADFHSKCDGHFETLTIIKANGSPNVFGGFTSASWGSKAQYKSDVNAFIYSLVNRDNKPIKMRVNQQHAKKAICCASSLGPTFGAGHDFYVAQMSNTNTDSFSNLGVSYTHPQYRHGTDEAQCFLAGSSYFQVSDIEIYSRD